MSDDGLDEQLGRLADRISEDTAPPVDDQYAIWADEPTTTTETYKCRVCWDTGFKEVGPQTGHGTVKPCPSCRPEQHARWASGQYLPNWRRKGNG